MVGWICPIKNGLGKIFLIRNSSYASTRAEPNLTGDGTGQPLLMELIPLSLAEANAFVERFHRHHKPVPGCKFSLGVSLNGRIVGVAIVGRPVARMLDDGLTLEVNRTCTDGTKNANSFLYGRAWRAAQALGYKKLITYTLPEESGSSLRGAGWKCLGLRGGGSWSRSSRPRVDTAPLGQKLLWEAA